MSKLDEKGPSYAKVNVFVPKWHLTYSVPIDGHFGQIVRYGLQISRANFGLNQKSASMSM